MALMRDMITRRTLITWFPVGLVSVVAIVQPLAPVWVIIALMLPALALMFFGLMGLQREWNDVNEAVDLEEKWRRQRERC